MDIKSELEKLQKEFEAVKKDFDVVSETRQGLHEKLLKLKGAYERLSYLQAEDDPKQP